MSTGRWLLGKVELHLEVRVILARLHLRRAYWIKDQHACLSRAGSRYLTVYLACIVCAG